MLLQLNFVVYLQQMQKKFSTQDLQILVKLLEKYNFEMLAVEALRDLNLQINTGNKNTESKIF